MGIHIKIQPLESVLAYLCLGSLFILSYHFLQDQIQPLRYIEFLKYSTLGLLLLNVTISTKIYGFKIYHPYLLLLGTISFFILSRIALDIVYKSYDFAYTNMLSYYKFSPVIQTRLLTNILISLFSIQIGAGVAVSTLKNSITTENKLKPNLNWRKIGLFFFYLGMPFLFYQYYSVAREVYNRGYVILYDGTLNYSNSIITVFFSRLAWVGFFSFLASMPEKRSLQRNLVLFCLLLIPRLLQGSRGPVMCIVLILFWFYFYSIGLDIKPKRIVLIIFSLFFINVFVGSLRDGGRYQNKNNFAKLFVYDQGISIQVLGYAIEHEAALSDYTFSNMFAKLYFSLDVARRKIKGQKTKFTKDEVIDNYGSLSYRITNLVNRERLLSGIDIGGSYLAEYYLLGKEKGQAIGGFLLGFFLLTIVEKFRNNRVGVLILLLTLPSIIYIPRDSTFDFIADNMSNVILFTLVAGLMFLVVSNKAHFTEMLIKIKVNNEK